MVKLLDDGDNILTRVQSTDAITAELVLKSAKKRADALSTTTGKTILPTITAQTEAQEETDQLNDINQSVIGAKEGVVEAVSKLQYRNWLEATSPTPFLSVRTISIWCQEAIRNTGIDCTFVRRQGQMLHSTSMGQILIPWQSSGQHPTLPDQRHRIPIIKTNHRYDAANTSTP